jgi:hypothetical protein
MMRNTKTRKGILKRVGMFSCGCARLNILASGFVPLRLALRQSVEAERSERTGDIGTEAMGLGLDCKVPGPRRCVRLTCSWSFVLRFLSVSDRCLGSRHV